MSDPSTSLYVILGATLRGLYELGESPERIKKGFDGAMAAIITPDPIVETAAENFGMVLLAQSGMKP